MLIGRTHNPQTLQVDALDQVVSLDVEPGDEANVSQSNRIIGDHATLHGATSTLPFRETTDAGSEIDL